MKLLKLILLFIYCLATSNLFAQSPQAIETDLLQSFKKIDYNNQDNGNANDQFAKKLKKYAEKYPFSIRLDFASLKAARLDISTSTDNLFRIYSWDTWTGGTMHYFENVFQYKYEAKTFAQLDTPKTEGDNCPNYYKMFTFKVNDQTYYLPVYKSIGSSRDVGEGICVYTLKAGKLNEVKIIKTPSGLHNKLSYNYDFGSVVDWKVRPFISFDNKAQTIQIPLVTNKGKVTHKYIIYKFTGQYFEKVKN
ncbi:MAG: hypothetical protein AAGC65_20125 [Mucilaginibacter sp.]|uniref:hypothetical protein n=1 Tax=Mucilaginibacter sp. TaxID=1882438 RepID=UPI0031A7220A